LFWRGVAHRCDPNTPPHENIYDEVMAWRNIAGPMSFGMSSNPYPKEGVIIIC